MVTSYFSPEVEIRSVRACAMHPAIIIGTVRSLWMWLWGRYHVPQNAFLVIIYYLLFIVITPDGSQTYIYTNGIHSYMETIKTYKKHRNNMTQIPYDFSMYIIIRLLLVESV